MGKPTGFMEYNRELPDDRSPLDRIEDWDEFPTANSISGGGSGVLVADPHRPALCA